MQMGFLIAGRLRRDKNQISYILFQVSVIDLIFNDKHMSENFDWQPIASEKLFLIFTPILVDEANAPSSDNSWQKNATPESFVFLRGTIIVLLHICHYD